MFAAKGGTVTMIGVNTPGGPLNGYGNAVIVRHSDNTYALYAHMKDGSVLVHVGQVVAGGQQLGLMGATSNGNFSPLMGQSVAAWTAAARLRHYFGAPMIRHTHIELRRANPDGSSPYPGPYPQSAAQATTATDPALWLRSLGVQYSSRGAATIVPGSDADTSHSWSRSLSGTLAVLGFSDDEREALGQSNAGAPSGSGYEPVAFERDVRFGLTPVEWGAVGVSALAAIGFAALMVRRNRVAANRRSGPRSGRLRAWGEK